MSHEPANLIAEIKDRVRPAQRRILLPECFDDRILQAAAEMARQGFCRAFLLGEPSALSKRLAELGAKAGAVEIIDRADKGRTEAYVNRYHELRRAKGMTPDEAHKALENPVFYGALCLREGLVDGVVAGAATATPVVLRAALHCIGTRPGIRTLSSCFLMLMPRREFGMNGTLLFSDPAVVIEPTIEQLVDITLSAALSWRQFTGTEPVVACLSFSTKGSARHPAAEKMAEVVRRVRQIEPTLRVDGELQVDAAIVPDVAALKCKGSPVAGRANILIFPDLGAGNIGYKLAERLGGGQAVGSILQGLAKPINDLSRGCHVQDIVDTAALTAAQTFAG